MVNKHFKTIEEYSEFYGLKFEGVEHTYFEFKAGGFDLAGQIFLPREYKATIILVHGYMGHCGVYGKFIKYMLDSHYALATFDLPGHGLSSGEQTAIDDFSQYSNALDEFFKVIKTQLHGSFHIVGHSMGCAVVMNHLIAKNGNLKKDFSTSVEMTKSDDFGKVILTAPLVQCTMWIPSKIGYAIYSPFLKNIFRVFRNISSDKEYVQFLKHRDPMQSKIISLKWVRAMFKWNKKFNDGNVINKPIFVVQGTNDKTVAWQHNLKFIHAKFKNAEIEFIENAQHELFNEAKQYRDEVFSLIREYLNGK